ncbi:hypothetical protein D3C73_1219700 [compost metagenome]
MGGRHRQQCSNAHAARRLAEHGNTLRVAAKSGDIALHPAESSNLIQQAEIGVKISKRCEMQEAERAQPVIDGDHNYPAC